MAMQENEGMLSMPTGDYEADTSVEVLEDDPELIAIKARVKEMEDESEKLKQMQLEAQREIDLISPGTYNNSRLTVEEKIEIDTRSVYVGNVDYGATANELESHFHGCGSVNRVTILCDKYTGNPKGFAYIEFTEKESVPTAMALDESLFRGRNLKVMPKRTNRPGISSTNRPPFSRGSRRAPRVSRFGGYRPMRRAMRRRSWFWPY